MGGGFGKAVVKFIGILHVWVYMLLGIGSVVFGILGAIDDLEVRFRKAY